jgi:choline dehydrogenase-like flavoprotein
MQAARSLAFVDGVRGRNGYVIESAPGHPGLIALALPWEGTAAHAALMARLRYLGPLIAITRDGGRGRVRATAGGGARIDYRLDRVGVATLRHGLATMARILRAAGAPEMLALGTPALWHRSTGLGPGEEATAFDRFVGELGRFDFGPNRGTVFSAHQMGTARFGADPRTHACDPAGRVRSGSGSGGRDATVPGLYVADTSLFPTGLGVNPMLTAMALARRVSRTVLAEG